MSKKTRKARRSLWKIIECGTIFFHWWMEASKDKVIDKEEQKEIIYSLLDVWGDTDIKLE